MNAERNQQNKGAGWRYEDWHIDWRAIMWVAVGGAVAIAVALGGNWLLYETQPGDFSPTPTAQFPGPGLNAADDRTPQWRQVRALSAADSKRIAAAMQRVAAKGDAAWDRGQDETP
jgi:hypothetical protein